MFRQTSNNTQTARQKRFNLKKTDVGIVTEVILDETNESLPKFKTVGEGATAVHTGKVGGVKVRLLSNQEVNDDDLKIVYPLDDTLKTLPLLGEEVQVHTISGKKFYSRLLVDGTLNIQNTGNDKYKDQFGEGENVQGGGGGLLGAARRSVGVRKHQ